MKMSPSVGPLDTSGVGQGLYASTDYKLEVNGCAVPVQMTATTLGGPASFASFTVEGKTHLVIDTGSKVASAKVLPTSYKIIPKISGNTVEIEIDQPRLLTLEINGTYAKAFHFFGNPPEKNPPSASDPNVVYFGPGVHESDIILLKDNQTLYLAEGAVLRPKLPPGMTAPTDNRWDTGTYFDHFIQVKNAKNVKICGYGLIDLSNTPWHACRAIIIKGCTGVTIEGITLIDTPAWGIVLFQSNDVQVRNIKQICSRENSDGIDISNCQDVLVENSFLRNNDDEICVKTLESAPVQPCARITVQNCIIWNERARGLGITSETRQDISDVTFRDCDVIHDFSKAPDCSCLAVLISDSGTVSNIRFENIRVEDSKKRLVLCWIGADQWGRDEGRGHLNGVTFKNITVDGEAFPESELTGFDAQHMIENVTFDHVSIHGKIITSEEEGMIRANAFVSGVKFIGANGESL